MAMNEPLPLELIIAPVYGALFWLLYYQIGHDMFPETAVHAFSPYQDRIVQERAGQLIDVGRRLFVERASPPPADPHPLG
jgi:hypothetical protein